MDVLYEIEQELLKKDKWFEFTNDSSDGRINSIQDEDIVLDWIFSLYNSRISPKKSARDLADFWIDDIPMNVKVTRNRYSQFNNIASVPSLFSHCMNMVAKTNSDVARCTNEIYMNGFLTVNSRKYGLLIISKDDDKKFWVGTFDELHGDDVYMNPSNGFQVRAVPQRYVTRNACQYISFFLTKIHEYYKKIAEPYIIMTEFTH